MKLWQWFKYKIKVENNLYYPLMDNTLHTTSQQAQQKHNTLQVMAAKSKNNKVNLQTIFDTDLFIIGVNNHASRFISNKVEHFISPLQSANYGFIKGVGGELLEVRGKGKLVWQIEDDYGRIHKVAIPDALYVPKSPIRLLSPQHWSQPVNNNYPEPDGTWCENYHDCLILYWDQRQYQKTIIWDRRTLQDFDQSNVFCNIQQTRTSRNKGACHFFITACDTRGRRNYGTLQCTNRLPTITNSSEQSVPQSINKQAREENISNFMSKIPTQMIPNMIVDNEGCLVAEDTQTDFL